MGEEEYEQMVERYKIKRSTDECYTPDNVYKSVTEWACRQYGFSPDQIVRPFKPGGDYEHFDYPRDCVVLDNPPFSILSGIIRFYTERKIDFFLFAPTLTCFNAGRDRCNYVITDVTLTYHNGARIRTSFVTNMGEYVIYADPSIDEFLTRCEEENTGRKVRKLTGIDYPVDVATTSNISAILRQGIPYKVKAGEARHVSKVGDPPVSIFGGGLLLSRKAAEEKAAEEKAAEERGSERRRKVTLSNHDMIVQREIGNTRQQELF